MVGELPTELVPHFFRSLSDALAATLQMSVKGDNTHHMVETLFKGFGRALRPPSHAAPAARFPAPREYSDEIPLLEARRPRRAKSSHRTGVGAVSILSMLAIVDSGGANIASVRFALQRLGVESELTADPAVIRSAARVILPGVGSAGEGMKRLRERGLVDCVRRLTQPVLGVCLGMQLLFENSGKARPRPSV